MKTELQIRVLPSVDTLEQTVSFVQVRGSVPGEETGNLPPVGPSLTAPSCTCTAYWTEEPRVFGPLLVKIPDDVVETSLDPFKRHIRHLNDEYGPCHAMAYLHGPRHGELDAETKLLQVYERLVEEMQHSPDSLAGQITLDPIELESRGYDQSVPRQIGEMADNFLSEHGWTHIIGKPDGPHATLIRKQDGVLRINCRECVCFPFPPSSGH